MPKLIRLTTNDDTSYFNNSFNEDILIEPKSKIALYNLSAEIVKNKFNVNSQNNKITYNVGGVNDRNVFLLNGIYDKDNIDTLFFDMTEKLNGTLSSEDEFEVGKQWNVELNDNKVNIDCKQSKSSNHFDDIITKNAFKKQTGGEEYYRDGGISGNPDSFMWIDKDLCKGSGFFRIRIYDIITGSGTATENAEFIVGLVNKELDNNSVIDLNEITYGIKLDTNVSNNYYYIKNGVQTATAQAFSITATGSQLNDNLEFVINEGKLQIRIDRDAGTTTDILYEENYSGEVLYPFVQFINDENSIIFDRLRYTSDPFSENTNLKYVEPSTRPVDQFFTFESKLFAEFLGFNNLTINKSSVVNLNIVADNQFKALDLSESYIVELLNINLLSYNSSIKQRQNILTTIVNNTQLNDRIIFTAPYPLYIEMNNANPITLRNIRARILKEDGSQLQITGISQMTILID